MNYSDNGMFKQSASFLFILILGIILSCLCPQKVMAKDNITVVIDPGHGGNNPEGETDFGASYNGVYEKEIDLITATALRDELSSYENVTVFMTRTEDVHMELTERADFANTTGADIFISVHYNASAHHRFYGTEIFTSAYGEEYARGYSLAENIMRFWKDAGNVSKGVKVRLGDHGDYYGVIRACREYGIPAVILEHGYLDNEKDFDRLNNTEAWEAMGRLDAGAIADFYGLKKGVKQESIRDELSVPVPENHVEADEVPPVDVEVSIDSYNPETGELRYTISAREPESFLMYYDLDTAELAADEDLGFLHLKVWEEGASSMQGTYTVPENFRGPFVARVYNNYEKFTDTEPVDIPEYLYSGEKTETASETAPETAEKTANRDEEQWNTEFSEGSDPEAVSARENSSAFTADKDDRRASANNLLFLIIVSAAALLFTVLVVLLSINAVVISKRRRRRRKLK